MHQELVLVSPAQPHQFLSVLKVLVTVLGISAYYRRKELDWSLTATKDLKWYSVATTKNNKNKAKQIFLVGLKYRSQSFYHRNSKVHGKQSRYNETSL